MPGPAHHRSDPRSTPPSGCRPDTPRAAEATPSRTPSPTLSDPTPPSASYRETYRVPFGDTDAAGVVFYPNYYRWFDRMTHELLRSLGVPLDTFLPVRQAPVLAETGCRFLASARYDDLLTLTAGVTSVRTRSFRVEHKVLRGDEIIAEGFEVRIWVEMLPEGARSIALPTEVVAAFGSPG